MFFRVPIGTWHHPHRGRCGSGHRADRPRPAAHLEAAHDHPRPPRVRQVWEGEDERQVGHGESGAPGAINEGSSPSCAGVTLFHCLNLFYLTGVTSAAGNYPLALLGFKRIELELFLDFPVLQWAPHHLESCGNQTDSSSLSSINLSCSLFCLVFVSLRERPSLGRQCCLSLSTQHNCTTIKGNEAETEQGCRATTGGSYTAVTGAEVMVLFRKQAFTTGSVCWNYF